MQKDFKPKYDFKPNDLSRSVRGDPYAVTKHSLPLPIDKAHSHPYVRKPYKCKVCNKCFTENSVLTKHMHMHNRRTLLKCTECSECFAFRSKLLEHVRSIHNFEELYKCTECGKCYTQVCYYSLN
ncbi:hypothetical protein CEXT_267671 [Caerostris extrusa]|uniref:C2H2-type domain-containing protein n=1 Tax=Caerostris extrusa TaxID=172846 RepID=A0AAV4YBK3_CAEEX|nr:hypothetical protein CEXT_267671 [Caerostris extrusa]